MVPDLENKLRARGEELTEDHDEADIAAVIEEVRNLNGPESARTAEMLEMMVEGQKDTNKNK